jgi:membrane-associated protease RseP (regulator of RpoE activity)
MGIRMNTDRLIMRSRLIGPVVVVLAGLLSILAPAAGQQAPQGAAAAGWIGITFVDDPAGGQAILVEEIVDGAPAAAAGIRPGDRIVRWNGRADVAAAVRSADLRPGENVRVRITRAGESERDVTITAALRPPRYAVATPGRWGDVFVFPRDTIWRPDRLFVLPDDSVLRPSRIYRFNRDSLAIQMDSLNAQLRLMLRDSLGPVMRYRELQPGALFQDSIWRGFGERSAAAVWRSFGGDSIWATPSELHYGPRSLAVALATGRNAVAGAELTDITPGLSNYFDTEEGALILRVAPDTPAARAGLQDGDVIVRVGDQPISGVAELRWALSRPGSSEFSIEIIREGARRTVTLGR